MKFAKVGDLLAAAATHALIKQRVVHAAVVTADTRLLAQPIGVLEAMPIVTLGHGAQSAIVVDATGQDQSRRRHGGAVHLLPRNSKIVLTNSAAVSVRTAFKAGSKISMSDLAKLLRKVCSFNPSLAESWLNDAREPLMGPIE
jgi:hypothetical protein